MEKSYIEVNYIKQLNAFYDRLLDIDISTNARMLYLALLQCWNKSGDGSEWERVISPTLKRLGMMTDLSVSQIDTARAEIVELGFLDYVAGSGKAHGQYTMYLLYEQDTTSTAATAEPAAQGADFYAEGGVLVYSDTTSEAKPNQIETKSKPNRNQTETKPPKKTKSAHNRNNNINKQNRERNETATKGIPLHELSLDQQKAVEKFVKLYPAKSEGYAEILYPPDVDFLKLIKAVEDSPQFLQCLPSVTITWLLKHYTKVIADFYIDKSLVSQPQSGSTAHKSQNLMSKMSTFAANAEQKHAKVDTSCWIPFCQLSKKQRSALTEFATAQSLRAVGWETMLYPPQYNAVAVNCALASSSFLRQSNYDLAWFLRNESDVIKGVYDDPLDASKCASNYVRPMSPEERAACVCDLEDIEA